MDDKNCVTLLRRTSVKSDLDAIYDWLNNFSSVTASVICTFFVVQLYLHLASLWHCINCSTVSSGTANLTSNNCSTIMMFDCCSLQLVKFIHSWTMYCIEYNMARIRSTIAHDLWFMQYRIHFNCTHNIWNADQACRTNTHDWQFRQYGTQSNYTSNA